MVGGTFLDEEYTDNPTSIIIPDGRNDPDIFNEQCGIFSEEANNYMAELIKYFSTGDLSNFPKLATIALVFESVGATLLWTGITNNDPEMLVASGIFVAIPIICYLNGLNQE